MTEARDIGIDVKTPDEACEDSNCPFHGNLPIRGRLFEGEVTSSAADNTATVKWEFAHRYPKYERYARKNTKVVVHNPPCIGAEEGDNVRIAECRPLSKTKSFVIIDKEEIE